VRPPNPNRVDSLTPHSKMHASPLLSSTGIVITAVLAEATANPYCFLDSRGDPKGVQEHT
jgi:hypothetical protein